MKLSKEQKKILKSIPNKKIRLEQKLQFKIQNKKENQPLNLEPLYAVDLGNGATLFRRKCKLAEQPENHNSTIKKGVFYKGKIFDTMEEALEYAPMSETTLERIKEVHKNWMGLANEFISPEKAIEILSQREKPRAIDPITPFTPDQIETVIDWMNTWEQLKDTVIPIRFKEDFANKL